MYTYMYMYIYSTCSPYNTHIMHTHVHVHPYMYMYNMDTMSPPPRRTADNETLLVLAIRHQLHTVVDKLCDMGADLSISDRKGNSPLWVALRSRQDTCAQKLVSSGQPRNILYTCTCIHDVGLFTCDCLCMCMHALCKVHVHVHYSCHV